MGIFYKEDYKFTYHSDKETADNLLTGFSPAGEALASMGPLLGLAAFKKGEITREQYLADYDHRGPH